MSHSNLQLFKVDNKDEMIGINTIRIESYSQFIIMQGLKTPLRGGNSYSNNQSVDSSNPNESA